ncbi:MAG: sporulation protein YtxC [Paraclostridium sp.]
MTLKTTDIYLDLLPKYELAANQFIQSNLFKKKIKYDKDYIEIKVSLDEDKENSKLDIAGEITNILVSIIREDVLKGYVHKTYSELYGDEENEIYKQSLNIFSKKETIIKESLFHRVIQCIGSENYINIDGFVKFRMKELLGYISNIVDIALEEYIMKKDHDEFINVLKYFIEVQDGKIDILKVYIKKDNSVILCDKDDKIIENENDEELINMFVKENLNYEDFLISTLLSLCPKEILIYNSAKNHKSNEIIETIKSIFAGRVKEMIES